MPYWCCIGVCIIAVVWLQLGFGVEAWHETKLGAWRVSLARIASWNINTKAVLRQREEWIRFSYSNEDTKDEEGKESLRQGRTRSRCSAPTVGTHHNTYNVTLAL